MSRTALQLVNTVLTRLREDTVSDFSDSYTKLILEFVNETLQEVQDAHQWEVLVKSVTFSTVASQQTYDISKTQANAGDVDNSSAVATFRSRLVFYEHPTRGRMPLAFDTTDHSSSQSAYQIDVVDFLDGTGARFNATTGSSSSIPTRIQLFSSYSDEEVKVYFFESPSAARTIKLYFLVPDEYMENTTDTTVLPWRPITLGAYAKALEERGEELGPRGERAMAAYQSALDAEIMHDSYDFIEVAQPE